MNVKKKVVKVIKSEKKKFKIIYEWTDFGYENLIIKRKEFFWYKWFFYDKPRTILNQLGCIEETIKDLLKQ